MATTAVPIESTRVLWSERRNSSSPRTVCQLASVHGSGTWKKPKSFMKVPSSANATGTPSTTTTSASTPIVTGPRARPRAWTRFWNWPVTVV